MKNFFLFLTSAAALIFLTVFLISSSKNQAGPGAMGKLAFVLRPSPTPTPSPWLIYSNPHNGYSLNYPRDWAKSEWEFHEATQLGKTRGPQEGMIWQQVSFTGKERSFQVLIWVNRQRIAVPQWLGWYRHEDLDLKKIPQKSNYQILGKEAYLMFSEKTSWGYSVVRIFFFHKDHIFELIAQGSSENLDPIYQEMISSFKLSEAQ